jgi:T-complex protein 1 subunit eta
LRRCVQQPQIVLLREGTDTSQGKAQLISNINACCAVVDAVRTTLVRRGAARRGPGPAFGRLASAPV